VVSSAGGFAASVSELRSARRGLLAVGGLAEMASYLALGLLLRHLVGERINRLTGVRLGLVVAGLGNILPAAPAEGLAMAGAELRRRGIDTRRTRIALGLMQWLSVRTVFLVAAVDALAIAVLVGVRYPQQGGRFVLGAMALVVLAVLAATAWLASRRQTIELNAMFDLIKAFIAAYHVGDPFSSGDSWRCWRRKAESKDAERRGARRANCRTWTAAWSRSRGLWPRGRRSCCSTTPGACR